MPRNLAAYQGLLPQCREQREILPQDVPDVLQSPTGTAAERQKQRRLRYDRNVVVKQVSAAKGERDAFLRQHRNFPTRRCSRCHEDWELLSTRFPKYKLPSGREVHRKICRFCVRASARLRERAERALVRVRLPRKTATPLAPTGPQALRASFGD